MARICEDGGRGWFLPFEGEHNLAGGLRTLLYSLGLIYCFLGIAIIADIFMSAIESVTSRKRQQRLPSGQLATTKMWNDTVATLSLMALGSSAPEIFLSTLDLFKKEMHSGDLGPSTIVGSAAFNLFVITAICCWSIPEGQTRWIKQHPAFFTTAVVSLAAYMWLAFILVVSSPDTVEVWEGVLTMLYLPVFIWISYSVDCGVAKEWLALAMALFGKGEGEASCDTASACLSFMCDSLCVGRSARSQKYNVSVSCAGERHGPVSCSYRTESLGAVPSIDYTEVEGSLDFPHGVDENTITLQFPPSMRAKNPRTFLLILEKAEGHVIFDPTGDGGESTNMLTIRMEDMEVRRSDRWSLMLDRTMNIDSLRCGSSAWAEQVADAVRLTQDDDENEKQQVRAFDVIFHVLCIPWKLLFSIIVPPTHFWGGWLCFHVSISLIGLLTAFVSDLTELFGCVVGLPDIVTAVTIVALGTSMPDLFASLTAAKEDPYADASIVNVTGSNSVNVFLGLGVPWSIASVYWSMVGRTDDWAEKYPDMLDRIEGAAFVVESRNLGFSVLAFCGCSMLCFMVLVLRRRCVGGELGGPTDAKLATSACFILLWVGFVSLTCWRVLRCKGASPGHWCKAEILEQMLVCGGIGCVLMLATVCASALVVRHRHDKPDMLAPDEELQAHQQELSARELPLRNAGASGALSGGEKGASGDAPPAAGSPGGLANASLTAPHGFEAMMGGEPGTSGSPSTPPTGLPSADSACYVQQAGARAVEKTSASMPFSIGEDIEEGLAIGDKLSTYRWRCGGATRGWKNAPSANEPAPLAPCALPPRSPQMRR